MIDIGQLAPVGKTVIVAVNPFDGLLFETPVVVPGLVLNPAKVHDSFLPGLTKNGYRKVLL